MIMSKMGDGLDVNFGHQRRCIAIRVLYIKADEHLDFY